MSFIVGRAAVTIPGLSFVTEPPANYAISRGDYLVKLISASITALLKAFIESFRPGRKCKLASALRTDSVRRLRISIDWKPGSRPACSLTKQDGVSGWAGTDNGRVSNS